MATEIKIGHDCNLTLRVGADLSKLTYIRVHRQAMKNANPTWNMMLDGIRRSVPKGTDGMFDLPQDDPEALTIILRIAHGSRGQDEKIPKLVRQSLLLQIAILCDKYDMSTLLKPFVSDWMNRLGPLTAHEDFLFLAYAFKLKDMFVSMGVQYTKCIRICNNGHVELVMDHSGGEMRRFVTTDGKAHLEVILEKLKQARRKTINELAHVLQTATHRADNSPCVAPAGCPYTLECNTLIRATLLDSLAKDPALHALSRGADPGAAINQIVQRVGAIRISHHGYWLRDPPATPVWSNQEGKALLAHRLCGFLGHNTKAEARNAVGLLGEAILGQLHPFYWNDVEVWARDLSPRSNRRSLVDAAP